MSIPVSTCLRTTSATAAVSCSSGASPSSAASASGVRWSAPTCVVRIRLGHADSRFVAIRAPSASASSFAHWIVGCTRSDEGALGKAAVGPAHHALAADEVRQAHEPLGDELRMLDDVRVVGDDAGDEHLALGQLHVLPQPPLVLVPGIRLLHQVVAGGHLQDQVDQVGERRVVDVRAVPAAEADVVADAVLGHTRAARGRAPRRGARPSAGSRRPTRRGRGSSRTRASARRRRPGPSGRRRRSPCTPRAARRRRRRRTPPRFGVVLVVEPVDARGRDDRQEGVGDVDAGERGLEAGDVALERGRVVLDRPGAVPPLRLRLDLAGLAGRGSSETRTWFWACRANSASCSA